MSPDRLRMIRDELQKVLDLSVKTQRDTMLTAHNRENLEWILMGIDLALSNDPPSHVLGPNEDFDDSMGSKVCDVAIRALSHTGAHYDVERRAMMNHIQRMLTYAG